jgi:hypothetical protein
VRENPVFHSLRLHSLSFILDAEGVGARVANETKHVNFKYIEALTKSEENSKQMLKLAHILWSRTRHH